MGRGGVRKPVRKYQGGALRKAFRKDAFVFQQWELRGHLWAFKSAKGWKQTKIPWKAGISVRNSISHSTCLCLRMRCYLGSLKADPESTPLWPDSGAIQKRGLSLQKFQTSQPVSTLHWEAPRGPGECLGWPTGLSVSELIWCSRLYWTPVNPRSLGLAQNKLASSWWHVGNSSDYLFLRILLTPLHSY